MVKMAYMLLTNSISRESAEKYVEKLDGRTYMNFHIAICPVGGSFDVWVESNTGVTHNELKEMVIEVLAQDLISNKIETDVDELADLLINNYDNALFEDMKKARKASLSNYLMEIIK